MRLVTGVPNVDLNDVAASAKRSEAAGYDVVTTQENRHDPFLPLAVAAVSTERIELATGISIAFARSPMVFANLGWDLQKASKGRFVLGLGSQVKGHNERRFSVPWSAPAPRMRECVQAIRAIWDCWGKGEKLDYQGEHYRFSLMTPNFTPEPLDGPPPAITIAAVGPAMMRAAGEVCDGARLHGFCTRRYLEKVALPRLEGAMAKVGRSRASFEFSGGGFVATGATDEAVARAFEWVRMRVGFYGSTRAYWSVFAEHGLEDLGEKLNHMSKAGQRDAMTKEVSDDVVHLFAAVGRHDELKTAVEARFGGLVDTVGTGTPVDDPGGLPRDLIQDLQAIDTPFAGFST
ncbi:MAG: TIGR03617 family F420-dependent LLM class oxidoreductase [Gammaproteobacteria bacterium]